VWRDFIDRYRGNARLAYDLGCGSGVLTWELASRGMKVVGVDGSAEMLAVARRGLAAHDQLQVRFEEMSLPLSEDAPLGPAPLIISSSCLEYLDSVTEALYSIRRLLTHRGIVIFSISNHDSFSRKLVRFVHRWSGRPKYLKYLRHFMTLESIRNAIAEAQLTYLEHGYFEGADRLNHLLGGVCSAKRSHNMIIVAARRD
jgi:SAM-dependent methyltransferase